MFPPIPPLPPKLVHALISALTAFLTAMGVISLSGCGTLHLHQQPDAPPVVQPKPPLATPQVWRAGHP